MRFEQKVSGPEYLFETTPITAPIDLNIHCRPKDTLTKLIEPLTFTALVNCTG